MQIPSPLRGVKFLKNVFEYHYKGAFIFMGRGYEEVIESQEKILVPPLTKLDKIGDTQGGCT